MLKKNRWKIIFGSLLAVLLLGVGGAFFFRNVFANRTGNMLDASPQEIGNAAIEYTRKYLEVVSGTPQVVLNIPVKPTATVAPASSN